MSAIFIFDQVSGRVALEGFFGQRGGLKIKKIIFAWLKITKREKHQEMCNGSGGLYIF